MWMPIMRMGAEHHCRLRLGKVDPGVIGAVIGGGRGQLFWGRLFNRVAGITVVGGFGDVNLSVASVIGGGVVGQMQSGAHYSGISGGETILSKQARTSR